MTGNSIIVSGRDDYSNPSNKCDTNLGDSQEFRIALVSLERSGELAIAVGDSVSEVARPCDEFLEKVLNGFNETEECFKGLKKETTKDMSEEKQFVECLVEYVYIPGGGSKIRHKGQQQAKQRTREGLATREQRLGFSPWLKS